MMRRTCMVALVTALGWLSTPAIGAPPPNRPRPEATAAAAKTARAQSGKKPRFAGKLAFDDGRTSGRVFLVGGELHVGDGSVVRDAVIEIQGSRIVRVGGVEARKSIPTDAQIVDVTGKVVTPGLIAADSILGLVEIGGEASTRDDHLDNGHPIHAGYDASTAIFADSSLIQVNAIEGITTAAVSPNGALISGRVAWIDLLHGDQQGIVAVPTVAVDATLGQAYGGSRAATLAKLRETLADADFYRRNRRAFDRRQSRDLAAHPIDLEALTPVLTGEVPLTVTANRASDILALIKLGRELGIDVVVVGGAQAWRVADQLAAADVPVVLQPTHNLPAGIDVLGARLDNAARLHRAGVRIGIAVLDEGHNVRNVAQEAGIAVAHGLPHEAALSAITLEIARIYRMDGHYGSVAAGKVANVVVWDGDPFELSSFPVRVFVRGRPISMRSRQTILRDRYLDLGRYR